MRDTKYSVFSTQNPKRALVADSIRTENEEEKLEMTEGLASTKLNVFY